MSETESDSVLAAGIKTVLPSMAATTPSETHKREHIRSSKACIQCHNRKVKCDLDSKEEGEACTNCSMSNISCELYVRKKRRTNKWKGRSKRQSDDDSKISDVAGEGDLLEDKYIGTAHRFSNKVLPNAQKKYPELSEIRLDRNVVLKEQMAGVLRNELLVSNSEPFMAEVAESVVGYYNRIGNTRAYLLDETDVTVLDMYGCFNLPNEKLCWKYIDKFFDSLNKQLPIINKRAFYRDYYDLKHPPSPLLLNTILYIGANNCDNMFDPVEKRTTNDAMAEILFKRAKLIYDYSLESDPIPLVQVLLCFGQHSENMSSSGKNDLYWCRIAVTVAIQNGFHRDGNPSFNDEERQIVKILWWILSFKERSTTLGYGSPLMINLDECNVPMLEKKDFEGLEMSDLEIDYTMALASFSKLMGKLIIEQVRETRLTSNGFSIVPLLKKCDIMMINWLQSLPHALKFCVHDPTTHSLLSSLLLIHYYVTLIAVHQANIVRNTKEFYPSWAICFQAAQMVRMLMEYVINEGLAANCTIYVHNTLSTPMVVMLYHTQNSDKSIRKVANDYIRRIFWIVKNSHVKWPTSYPLVLALGTIYESPKLRQQMATNIMTVTDRKANSAQRQNMRLRDSFLKFSGNYGYNKFNASISDSSLGDDKLKFAGIDIDPDKLFTENVFTDSKSRKGTPQSSSDQCFQAESADSHSSTADDGLPLNKLLEVSDETNIPYRKGIADDSYYPMSMTWQPSFKVEDENIPATTDDDNKGMIKNIGGNGLIINFLNGQDAATGPDFYKDLFGETPVPSPAPFNQPSQYSQPLSQSYPEQSGPVPPPPPPPPPHSAFIGTPTHVQPLKQSFSVPSGSTFYVPQPPQLAMYGNFPLNQGGHPSPVGPGQMIDPGYPPYATEQQGSVTHVPYQMYPSPHPPLPANQQYAPRQSVPSTPQYQTPN